MFRFLVIASLVTQVVSPLQLQAMCEAFSPDDDIDFFPLAQMDSEIKESLKTTTEAGERKAVLFFEGDKLPALPDTLSEENAPQSLQRK